MNIEWKDSYLVGDGRIDSQHRHLFKLADLVVNAPDQNEFRLAAMQLYGYMRTHFADEEILMRTSNYPAYHEHQQLHNELLTRFNAISHSFAQGVWNKDEILAFMTTWLLEHIGQEDAKIAAYIRQQSP
ncbi:MAG: hemerythrin family protein [Rhodoferax sp.]|nr:hemerythrin family protein [Rhodoferax sp.]